MQDSKNGLGVEGDPDLILTTPNGAAFANTATGTASNTSVEKKKVVMSRTRLILETIFLFGGMLTYVADLITDTLVAVRYLVEEDYWWSGLTFAFIIIPSITIQYFSFRWFVVDSKENEHKTKVPFLKKILDWILWLMFHLLQLGAIKRYWRTAKYGWRSQKNPDYYDLSVYEYRDITMLRLVEAFMEAAPQLVLQVYIMTQQENIYWLTVASALISLVSLSWGLEAYHKALRESCSNKNNLGYVGLAFRMLWRTFTVTARVIALALFASYAKWCIFPVVGVHWVGMTLWLVYQRTDFCPTRLEEMMFDAVIGIIQIFCFFNVREGRTRCRMLFFYFVILLENTVLFALWYHHGGSETGYGLAALCFVWGGFFLGIAIMMFYYRCLHPNGNIRLWGGGGGGELSPPQVFKPVLRNNDDDAYGGRDEVDGPISWSEIVVPSSTRGCHGNLFSQSGRRYCYWRTCPGDAPAGTETTQPLSTATIDDNCCINCEKPKFDNCPKETAL